MRGRAGGRARGGRGLVEDGGLSGKGLALWVLVSIVCLLVALRVASGPVDWARGPGAALRTTRR